MTDDEIPQYDNFFRTHAATILDSTTDGIFTVDQDWKITSFNRAAELITGVTREEALGKTCCDVFRASICEADCALRHSMTTGESIVGKSIYIINAVGSDVVTPPSHSPVEASWMSTRLVLVTWDAPPAKIARSPTAAAASSLRASDRTL